MIIVFNVMNNLLLKFKIDLQNINFKNQCELISE